MTIDPEDALAVAVVHAIHTGDVATLRTLLSENPGLAAASLGDGDPDGMSRTLLHVATDWPGHFPNGAETVAVLVEAGADVNGRFRGPHAETPLHWAASSNDVEVLDALLDAGADIEAPGAVLGGGTPLADATGFARVVCGTPPGRARGEDDGAGRGGPRAHGSPRKLLHRRERAVHRGG